MSPTWRTAIAVALAALAALWVPVEAAGLACAVVVILFALDAWSVRRPPMVDRHLPTELVRGVAAGFSIDVDAGGRRVLVRQPQTADVRFDPSEAVGSLVGGVRASRRGRHEIGPVVTRTVGLLGLGRWTHVHGAATTIDAHADLPGGRRIAHAVQQGRFREDGARRGPLGLGTDFESVRDYTPDDDIRRMNWRATERLGRPMVNQYREDTDRELWCLIDAGRLLSSPVGDRTRLDAALDAMAAVAAVADVMGDRVGAVVFDDQVRRVIAPRRASAHDLVRALDTLEPTMADTDYDAAFARVGAVKRALVVVFTDLLDLAAARPLLDATPVLTRRHAVVIAGVSDPDLVAAVTTAPRRVRDLHEAVVSADLLAERRAAEAKLTASGAAVVDAPVDQFASACVGAYLRLKARARL